MDLEAPVTLRHAAIEVVYHHARTGPAFYPVEITDGNLFWRVSWGSHAGYAKAIAEKLQAWLGLPHRETFERAMATSPIQETDRRLIARRARELGVDLDLLRRAVAVAFEVDDTAAMTGFQGEKVLATLLPDLAAGKTLEQLASPPVRQARAIATYLQTGLFYACELTDGADHWSPVWCKDTEQRDRWCATLGAWAGGLPVQEVHDRPGASCRLPVAS